MKRTSRLEPARREPRDRYRVGEIVLLDPSDIDVAPSAGPGAPWRRPPSDGASQARHTFRLLNAARVEHDVTVSASPSGGIVATPPGYTLVRPDGLVDLPLDYWWVYRHLDEGRLRVDPTGVQVDIGLYRGRRPHVELGHLTVGIPARNILRAEVVVSRDRVVGGVLVGVGGLELGGLAACIASAYSQPPHPEPAVAYSVFPALGAVGVAFLGFGVWALLAPEKHVPIPIPVE